MKHCIQFPEDKFLAVRPCLVAICFGNRPAAKLLGTLLYRYNLRAENKEDAENQNAVKAANGEIADQDTTYRIFRKQSQLVDDMCGEMTEKTLHDVAVPMLQVLGYLDLEEHMQSNCYILNIEQIQQALNLYKPTSKEHPQLEKFLISHMQLEKFLITSDELEKFLIDKKNFLSGLEKVLIWNRNISYCKRGRKHRPAQDSKGNPEDPKNLEELSKKDTEEESNSAHTDTDTLAPPHVGALSLPQSSDIDNHSQSLPLSSTVTTRNEEGETDHAQPLQPLPTANHPDRGRGNVPSRDSQVNSTGFTSPLDTPPVGDTQAHSTVGGEGRAGVGEDTARGIGSGDAREADTTGDTARGQVTEGDDHAHLPAGSADRIGALPAPGGDSHDAAVDDRHVVAPEVGPVLEAGQEEEVNDGRTNSNLADMALADTGHHLPGVPDYCHKETAVEQIAPREDVPVVAASPLTTSTVEPGHGGWDAMPAAPVPGQEGVKPARSRQSKVKPIPEGPPVMPAEDAPWCAETIVQICEARRGRRYPNGAKRKSDRERDVQLEYAKQLAEMPDIDREKLLKAASHQETRHDNWWMDTNGYISPKQLVEKDRIHNMLDELMRLERKKNLKVVPQSGSTNGISKPTNEPTTNIRELVRQREAARAAQVQ